MERTVLLAVIVAAALGAEVFECPPDETTGKFADPDFCDEYWKCFRGEPEKIQCADGLAFDPNRVETQREPCDYISNVNCTGRLNFQDPKGEGPCIRANGLFPHENDCGMYYSCKDNVATQLPCSPGLHFSLLTHTCDWEAAANRGSCTVLRSIGNFTCDPSVEYYTPDEQKIVHPTFPNYDDCALFYVCKNGVEPAISKCDYGTVYNIDTAKCEDPLSVPGCETYYELEAENAAEEAV